MQTWTTTNGGKCDIWPNTFTTSKGRKAAILFITQHYKPTYINYVILWLFCLFHKWQVISSVLDLSRFKKKINLVKSKNIKIQIQIIFFSFFFLKIKIKKIWSKSKSKIKSKNKIKNLKIKIKLKRTENFNLLIIY